MLGLSRGLTAGGGARPVGLEPWKVEFSAGQTEDSHCSFHGPIPKFRRINTPVSRLITDPIIPIPNRTGSRSVAPLVRSILEFILGKVLFRRPASVSSRMARGNQRDRDRQKNLDKQAKVVRFHRFGPRYFISISLIQFSICLEII